MVAMLPYLRAGDSTATITRITYSDDSWDEERDEIRTEVKKLTLLKQDMAIKKQQEKYRWRKERFQKHGLR
jgi:hypothetical protein